MAAEKANPLPFMGLKDIPETYKVPQAQAGVKGNNGLARAFGKTAELINHTLGLVSEGFFVENFAFQVEEMKNVIRNIIIQVHERIGLVGDNAFQIPEEILDALNYLEIPYPPEVQEGDDEGAVA